MKGLRCMGLCILESEDSKGAPQQSSKRTGGIGPPGPAPLRINRREYAAHLHVEGGRRASATARTALDAGNVGVRLGIYNGEGSTNQSLCHMILNTYYVGFNTSDVCLRVIVIH